MVSRCNEMDEKPKLTQGQAKTRLRLKELFENENFKSELSNILANPNKKKQNKLLWKLANKYSLEFEPGKPFLDVVMGQNPKLDKQFGHELDVCELYDEEDEYLNENFPVDFDIPPSRNPRRRAQIHAFPIHMGINIYATKRDVLDFVNKRWDYIRYLLDGNITEKPKSPRIKPKAQRDNLIWENRDLPAKEIADKVNQHFPSENLTYADINSILYYLRKRKFSKVV